MILGENHEKMSKSKGNVVNPDEIVDSHGADTLRLYEMFMGPLEASAPWSTTGLDGSRRFLDRVWRLIVNDNGTLSEKVVDKTGGELEKIYHQTVKKVTEDYEALRFNTGISQLMVFVNEANKAKELPKAYIEGFVKLLSPVCPHIAEELWAKLGHTDSITNAEWPTYDEAKTVENEVEIVIQINGKVRAKQVVAKDISKDELAEIAQANEQIQQLLEGKTIRKVIAVPGKLVNIVAN